MITTTNFFIATFSFWFCLLWFLVLMIFGKNDNWKQKLLVFSYPAIMIPIGFIRFGEDSFGLFLTRFGKLLLRDFLMISLLIFAYRFELGKLFIKNKRSVFLFFGTFLVPLTFFIIVQLVEPFLSQSIKVDLAMYWMKFFLDFHQWLQKSYSFEDMALE